MIKAEGKSIGGGRRRERIKASISGLKKERKIRKKKKKKKKKRMKSEGEKEAIFSDDAKDRGWNTDDFPPPG